MAEPQNQANHKVMRDDLSGSREVAPHPARFSFVATQRRPHRKIKSVDARADGTTLVLECGHIGKYAQHFHYTVGHTIPCSACGKMIAAELPEFNGWFDAAGVAIDRAAAQVAHDCEASTRNEVQP